LLAGKLKIRGGRIARLFFKQKGKKMQLLYDYTTNLPVDEKVLVDRLNRFINARNDFTRTTYLTGTITTSKFRINLRVIGSGAPMLAWVRGNTQEGNKIAIACVKHPGHGFLSRVYTVKNGKWVDTCFKVYPGDAKLFLNEIGVWQGK
jgi:hypothetical protein